MLPLLHSAKEGSATYTRRENRIMDDDADDDDDDDDDLDT